MGKKSKRRGGTGGKKSATGGTFARDQSAVSAARGTGGTLMDTPENLVSRARALLQVPKPESLKGIWNTNARPTKCMTCSDDTLGHCAYRIAACCGKAVCRDCGNSRQCLAPDLCGERRCIFCNAKQVDQTRILSNEAKLGKPWAQVMVGTNIAKNSPQKAFDWFEKAATRGHPFAFIRISGMFMKTNFVCDLKLLCDLKLSEALAKKAYSMSPDFALSANRVFCLIAHEHKARGQFDEAKGALIKVVNETVPRATDSQLNMEAANILLEIGSDDLASKVFARAFSQGQIETAETLFQIHSCREEYALAKLWLYVERKLKEAFGEEVSEVFPDLPASVCNEALEETRVCLRELRNSCGGCGTALEGDRRNMCRACRTYCYCSRECQKRHWNRSKDGHREECLLVQEHCQMISNTIREGKIKV